MNPLVSILIPAYNAEEFLADTLSSALSQTWPNTEIIVVDDGSKDETLAIARQFATTGLRVFSQKNQGAAAARNKAFSHARGAYIQWLDSDDLLAPEKIESQMQLLLADSRKGALTSAAWGRFMYRPEKARFVSSPLWCDLTPLEWAVRKLENNCYMQTATWLASRELIAAAGPWDSRLLGDDDGEYFCRVVLASEAVRFVPEARTYYRNLGSNSLSHIGFSDRKLEAHFLGMRLQIGYVLQRNDDARTRAACVRYLQDSLVYFYPNRPDLVKEAKALAETLGGSLNVPRFSWKYAWIARLLGARRAKWASHFLASVKTSWLRVWDKALHGIERSELS
jgi:glycosyltransferase involved in cell wall biosynthesis